MGKGKKKAKGKKMSGGKKVTEDNSANDSPRRCQPSQEQVQMVHEGVYFNRCSMYNNRSLQAKVST